MKKLLFISLMIVSIFSVFSISSFASSEEIVDMDSEAQTSEEDTFFGMLYEEISEHSDKLLAALSFVGSLIVIFAYKKGLLPIIKASLGALGTAVSSIKDESERASAEAGVIMSGAVEKLGAAEAVISDLSKQLENIEHRLEEANGKQLESKKVYTVISAQIDMLYEVFMSSSLPAYQKESVGEKITEMKRSLAESSAGAVNASNE